MHRDGIGLRQKTIIFDITLYTKLHNEMVLNSPKTSGAYFLGIKAMKVEFMAPEIAPLTLDSSMASNKSCRIKSKKTKKSYMVHPSGPGLFKLVEA